MVHKAHSPSKIAQGIAAFVASAFPWRMNSFIERVAPMPRTPIISPEATINQRTDRCDVGRCKERSTGTSSITACAARKTPTPAQYGHSTKGAKTEDTDFNG